MPLPKIVFWEVDTQVDFMLPGGKLYVPGAERIIPNIGRLVSAAVANGVPLIASCDSHFYDDLEFEIFPPHCVRGTSGAQIVSECLAEDFVTIPSDATAALPAGVLQHRQVILQKETLDVFDNPHASELVERLGRDAEYVVFGVVTEYCVKCAARGLLGRRRRVSIVTDAIKTLKPEHGRRTLDELGARLITTDQAIAML